MLRLNVENVGRWFGRRMVFENINFTLQPGESLAVVGPNGSGKTTLIKIITGLGLPTKGRVIFSDNGCKLDFDMYRPKLSLVAPYLALYDSLTAVENLRFLSRVNGQKVTNTEIETVLKKVGLEGRGGDMVEAYSTGMKQRLKYAAAIIKRPKVLLLDEPSANLDEAGRGIIRGLIDLYRENVILILATNEKEEYSLAGQLCQLGG
nr:ABC transporter ATP-binding protein [candidate division Zixibacteria bacterium]